MHLAACSAASQTFSMRSLVVLALFVAGCSNAKAEEERLENQKRIAAAEAATRAAEDRAQTAEERTKALEARVAALENRPVRPSYYPTPIVVTPAVVGLPRSRD